MQIIPRRAQSVLTSLMKLLSVRGLQRLDIDFSTGPQIVCGQGKDDRKEREWKKLSENSKFFISFWEFIIRR